MANAMNDFCVIIKQVLECVAGIRANCKVHNNIHNTEYIMGTQFLYS